jgi:tRNA nucleotidyltransferase/poly(A) polymerase
LLAFLVRRPALRRVVVRAVLPPGVRDVMARLEEHGHQAQLVGGCVRDLLLGRVPHDWDVATDALPERVLGLFPGAQPTGIACGTVTVPPRRRGAGARGAAPRGVEVTTYRSEGPYSDRRHPDRVSFVGSLDEDLKRRDVTINAMALDRRGRLYDPAGGLSDLRAGLLRAVGDPAERFAEDALRLMRVVRLFAETGFSIEPRTRDAIGGAAALLACVAAERVRDELLRVLASPRAGEGLGLLRATGLLAVVWPAAAAAPAETWARAVGAVGRAAAAGEGLGLRLSALYWGVLGGGPHAAAQARDEMQRLRIDSDTAARVSDLLRWLPAMRCQPRRAPVELRRAATRAGRATFRDLPRLCRVAGPPPAPGAAGGTPDGAAAAAVAAQCRACPAARAAGLIARGRCPLSAAELPVGGADVMRVLGLGPGPEVGRALAELLDRVLARPSLARRRDLLRLLAALRAEAAASGRRGHDKA